MHDLPLTTKYEIGPDHIIPVAQKQPTFCDATVPLVSPRNDFWGTSAEIPYWWHVITQIWVVLLIGRVENVLQPIRNATQIWEVSRHQYGISALLSQTLFREMWAFFLRLVIPWLDAFAFYPSSLMSYRYSQFQPSVSELNPYSSVANITPFKSESIWVFLTTACSPVCRWICSFVLWCLVTWCTTRSCSPVLVFLTLNPPWSAWLSYFSLYFHLIMR